MTLTIKFKVVLAKIYRYHYSPLTTHYNMSIRSLTKEQSRTIKDDLHQIIKDSDLDKLKEYVNSLQTSLLYFDNPSLLMLAVQTYLDPTCIHNEQFQQEIIIFLTKCGLRFYVPYGKIFLYLASFCHTTKSLSTIEKNKQDKTFDDKLVELFKRLEGYSEINNHKPLKYCNELPTSTSFHDPEYLPLFRQYITRYLAASIIQRSWKRHCMRNHHRNKTRNKI